MRFGRLKSRLPLGGKGGDRMLFLAFGFGALNQQFHSWGPRHSLSQEVWGPPESGHGVDQDFLEGEVVVFRHRQEGECSVHTGIAVIGTNTPVVAVLGTDILCQGQYGQQMAACLVRFNTLIPSAMSYEL